MACASCKKSPPEVTLKHCAKCSITDYCSRDCQKADWKAHKKICGKAGQEDPASGPSFANSSARPSASRLSPPKGLDSPIAKPFTRLDKGTWLHGRPEKDVYRLLIDAYRMRVEDMYKFDGDVEEDSIYAGNSDGKLGFSRFLTKVEKCDGGLLPAWWTPEKKAACVKFGSDGSDSWADLGAAVEKSDISEHYGDARFAMQLRMFAERVYGRGPGGSDATAMRKMMAGLENDGMPEGMVASTMDTTTGGLSPL
ncbi:putative MYND domain protein [Podospora appendiculata]|uniref:MYND domain protein n=1 Tax=Podospora appendiculata TaxID=314037 RepID=A0AAE1C7L4_9PEZI|nr:putative MYND domain protein [Podospora appendiculata]